MGKRRGGSGWMKRWGREGEVVDGGRDGEEEGR